MLGRNSSEVGFDRSDVGQPLKQSPCLTTHGNASSIGNAIACVRMKDDLVHTALQIGRISIPGANTVIYAGPEV